MTGKEAQHSGDGCRHKETNKKIDSAVSISRLTLTRCFHLCFCFLFRDKARSPDKTKQFDGFL